mmetsp:Transcript_31782/g.78809  ORF Transcript_31782/g.78809 Transcript_31782/m.78809 type:complete len:211 (-) Transcript_31782:1427-2059(-)
MDGSIHHDSIDRPARPVRRSVRCLCHLGKILKSADVTKRSNAARQIRELLSIELPSVTQAVVDAGMVPPLVELLKEHTRPRIQHEAVWSLTNIASGTSEQTAAVVDAGAVPALVHLVSSPDDQVADQATWALGNMQESLPPFAIWFSRRGVCCRCCSCLMRARRRCSSSTTAPSCWSTCAALGLSRSSTRCRPLFPPSPTSSRTTTAKGC